MSEDIVIRSKEEAIQLVFRLTQFEMQYPRWVKEKGIQLVKDTILPTIKKRMADFNYSPKIIDGTTIADVLVDTDGFMEIEIDSTYKTESGFDVAEAREKGTRTHWVAPVIKKALSFIIEGIRVFSKGHWVKGIFKSNVIEKTIEELTPRLQVRLNEETDEFFLQKVRP